MDIGRPHWGNANSRGGVDNAGECYSTGYGLRGGEAIGSGLFEAKRMVNIWRH